MAIFKKFTKDYIFEHKKYRNRELALAIALGATVGILTGITANSKSDQICKMLKKVKRKSSKYIEEGKNKIDDIIN